MKNKVIFIYKKFVMIWYSSFWLRFFATLLYVYAVKWLFIQWYGPIIPYNIYDSFPLEIDDKCIEEEEEKKLLEIKNLPKMEKTSYDRFLDYFTYFRYFPNGNDEEIPFIDMLSNNDFWDSIVVDTITYERTPLFTVVKDNILSDTIINPPPKFDNSLPFETPVTIIVSEDISDDQNELIRLIATYDIQGDLYNSIYGPSYIGPIIYSNDQIFNLQSQLVNDIETQLNKEDLLDIKKAQRITHKIIKQYMQDINIYKNLTVQTLQDTQHIVNRLLEDLIVYSIFEADKQQIIMHLICKAIIFEAISHIEYLEDIDDLDHLRYEQILTRFLSSSKNFDNR